MNEPEAVERRRRGQARGPHPLVELTLFRVREFVREPEALFWTFAFPILLAFVLGIAFRGRGVQPTPVALEAGVQADHVREALERFDDLEVSVLDPAAAEDALRKGQVGLVVIPGPEGMTYRYDPARPESRTARLQVELALARAAGYGEQSPAREDHVTERGARYIDFVIPGLLALNLMGTGFWGVGYAVVQLRTRMLLKRFVATPMRRSDFLLSFGLGRLSFLVVELAALLAFARLVFDVTVQGSLILFAAIAVVGGFTFAALGLLVASRAKTVEGVAGLMNLAMVPMWILSGVFFSSSRFPDMMQPLIRVLPLTPLVDTLRAVMNEGAGIGDVAGWMALVAAWGVASFAVALRIFRWN
ncbi:MAG: ABC transporter permease [Gemmatimonadetes bacterium]|nr:ABC transporter permease [Gemmatimonadota bacterium]